MQITSDKGGFKGDGSDTIINRDDQDAQDEGKEFMTSLKNLS